MNGFYRIKKKPTEMILLKSLIYNIGNGFLPSAVTILVLPVLVLISARLFVRKHPGWQWTIIPAPIPATRIRRELLAP
jgi:hypothetical protein